MEASPEKLFTPIFFHQSVLKAKEKKPKKKAASKRSWRSPWGDETPCVIHSESAAQGWDLLRCLLLSRQRKS